MTAKTPCNVTNNAVIHRVSQRIAVLMGGNSPEREVSLRSGKRIAEALRSKGYSVAAVDPSQEYAEEETLFSDDTPTPPKRSQKRGKRKNCRNCPKRAYCRDRASVISTVSSDKTTPTNKKNAVFTASSIRFCQKADLVFLALHGGAGEDGRIAAVLECLGIPHTGSDHKGLCVSMDKLLSKRILLQSEIPTPCFVTVTDGEFPRFPQGDGGEKDHYHGELPHLPPFPCVIKPVNGGSSIGVKIVNGEEELKNAIADLQSQKQQILIEEKIVGREFTVGILNGKSLAVTEIIPKSGFYDYENKYIAGRTEEITPAELDENTTTLLKETALKAHNALGLGSYSRIDIILETETNIPYVLEANALPGMTETSLLPQGAAAEGIDFETLCEMMMEI